MVEVMTTEQLGELLGQRAAQKNAPKPKNNGCENDNHAFRTMGQPVLHTVDGGQQVVRTLYCPRHNPPLIFEVPGEFIPAPSRGVSLKGLNARLPGGTRLRILMWVVLVLGLISLGILLFDKIIAVLLFGIILYILANSRHGRRRH